MASDRYSQPIENNGSHAGGSVAPVSPAQAEWVRNKHTGKKGEFRYF